MCVCVGLRVAHKNIFLFGIESSLTKKPAATQRDLERSPELRMRQKKREDARLDRVALGWRAWTRALNSRDLARWALFRLFTTICSLSLSLFFSLSLLQDIRFSKEKIKKTVSRPSSTLSTQPHNLAA